jgi:hypothetical protein
VRSRVIIASLKPWFSSPRRLAAGTSVSLNEIVAVLDALRAHLVLVLVDADRVVLGYDEG